MAGTASDHATRSSMLYYFQHLAQLYSGHTSKIKRPFSKFKAHYCINDDNDNTFLKNESNLADTSHRGTRNVTLMNFSKAACRYISERSRQGRARGRG